MPTPQYPVPFRIGRRLLVKIQGAADNEGVSRNTWIKEAIQRRLEGRPLLPIKTTAEELFSDRVPMMVRLDELTLDLLNEETDAGEGMTRTLWILDACLSSLQRKKAKNGS